MNVQVATLPHSQVSLDIEVESTAVMTAMNRAYRQLAERMTVPGFRKGKAPRAVLEAAVGRAAVLEEAGDIAINTAYQDALEQTGLEPITQAEIAIKSDKIDPTQPFSFTATFFVVPAVELGDYTALRVAPPKTEVTDEQVDEFITRMADTRAAWEPVEGRAAELGDVAMLDISGTVDGEVVLAQGPQEQFLNPNGPSEAGMPDVTPHVVGMTVGEARTFDLELPADYNPVEYAGKTMTCQATLTRLEHKSTPPLDDAFAQSLGEFKTMDEVRTQVRAILETQQRSQDADAFVVDVTQRVTDMATVDLPPPLVEDEIHRTLDNLKEEIESRQHLTMDLYLRVTGKTMEDLHEEVRGPAESRVKSNLVLEAIAAAEGLTAPREEVDAELRQVATAPNVRDRDRRRVLTSPAVRARLESRIARRLALQRLLEIAYPATDDGSEEAGAEAELRRAAAESHVDALEDGLVDPGGHDHDHDHHDHGSDAAPVGAQPSVAATGVEADPDPSTSMSHPGEVQAATAEPAPATASASDPEPNPAPAPALATVTEEEI